MVTAADRAQVYKSQQKDTWEFTQDASGYFWLRTASNNEVVGTSHRAYSALEDCETNAHIVGYQNQFNIPRNATWEFYQDSKKEHRWRLLDAKGVVVNRCHEGYKSKEARDKNAIRHGYELVASASGSGECMGGPCSGPRFAPSWLTALILLGFALLLLRLLRSLTPGVIAPNIIELQPLEVITVEQVFTDVPVTANGSHCIYNLVDEGVLQGYKTSDGTQTYEFGIDKLVSKQELAKIMSVATDSGLFACAPTSIEPAGVDWAKPYLRCAKAKQWRVYQDAQADYALPATKAELLLTLLDSFELSPQQADELRFFKALGAFAPDAKATRNEVAQALCETRAITSN